MKKLITIFILLSFTCFAQFKNSGFPKEEVRNGILNRTTNSIFNFLSDENFSMRHSFSMSYSSFAGQGLALGIYTNSMMYKFSENLNVQLDASIVNSPYSTFGKDFQNSINGLYLSRAAINYRPWKDVFISLQYNSYPFFRTRGLYNSFYDYYFGY
ncbi:MAG: hypothetical protein NZM09_07260 [Ignavibacterium sp.]|nr:hypothetical protein [Ignavibacterium sp.]MCX7610716.1 hypothetical protein [Ignavibacterium sp.]MDW8375480.1 hypothetical protein [Ignavibacteriales bacterium]